MTQLSLTELNKIFYDLTRSIISGSPLVEVRHSWPTGGAPAFKVSDNVIFLKIYDVKSPITDQQEIKYDASLTYPEKRSYTRTLMVNWICYGSLSWDYATDIRSKIFYSEHHDTLANNSIFIVPDFDPPKRLPELWQGQWYERCDLNISFNELVTIERDFNNIEQVPFGIYDKDGLITEITIEE